MWWSSSKLESKFDRAISGGNGGIWSLNSKPLHVRIINRRDASLKLINCAPKFRYLSDILYTAYTDNSPRRTTTSSLAFTFIKRMMMNFAFITTATTTVIIRPTSRIWIVVCLVWVWVVVVFFSLNDFNCKIVLWCVVLNTSICVHIFVNPSIVQPLERLTIVRLLKSLFVAQNHFKLWFERCGGEKREQISSYRKIIDKTQTYEVFIFKKKNYNQNEWTNEKTTTTTEYLWLCIIACGTLLARPQIHTKQNQKKNRSPKKQNSLKYKNK